MSRILARAPSAPAPLLAFLAAVLGHLPALRAFWSQDDWGLLARATGLSPEPALPARVLSQVLYWRALEPLFGLDPAPWALTRLLLHGGSAALLARIAARCGLAPLAALGAGLILAAAPVALAPIWSANAVQDLLALLLALAATDRWLAALGWTPAGRRDPAPPRARRDLLVAGLLGGLAMLAKESAFGLPVLWGALLWARRRGGERDAGERGPGTSAPFVRAAWLVVLALLVVAAGETALVLRHFDHSPGAAYALGSPRDGLFNLLIYGVWSVWAWPFYPTRFPALFYAAGLAVWTAWGVCAALRWRRGDRLCAAGGLAALLALAPLLPLLHHTIPYLVYPATAGLALALASLVPRRLAAARPAAALALAAAALAWSLIAMSAWLRPVGADGQPRDPLIAHTEISRAATRLLKTVPRLSADGQPRSALVLLQVPPSPAVAAQADRLDEHMVIGSRLHTAVGGEFGPCLTLGREANARWANRLDTAPPDALVLVEDGARWIPWGETQQARLYLALTLCARGCFPQAARALESAARSSGPSMPFLYDADYLLEPLATLRARAPAFDAYLADPAPRGAGLRPGVSASLRQSWRELMDVVGK